MSQIFPRPILRIAYGTPGLDAETERIYLGRVRNGDADALSALVLSHLRMVVSMARTYQTRAIALEDLVSEGVVGLCEAAKRFDQSRGTRFSTYARWWVRALVRHFALQNRRVVGSPTTRAQRRVMGSWSAVFRDLTSELGRDPTSHEIARAHGVRVTDVEAVRCAFDLSDRYIGAPKSFQLTAHDPSPETLAAERETGGIVLAALDSLDSREREIIERRYLRARRPTLLGLGRELGISRERVRQLEARAMAKLRSALQRTHGDGLAVS